MRPRAVILAAGASSRMGREKLLLPFRGKPMIEYAVDAAREWHPVLVANADVAAFAGEREKIDTVLNTSPERGMAHSLALADAAVPRDVPIVVLLGDKPLVTRKLIALLVERSAGADVVFPSHPVSREPGHPVIFSPRARAKIQSLPEGDTVKVLRDDSSLVRRIVETEDEGAYFDVDTAEKLE